MRSCAICRATILVLVGAISLECANARAAENSSSSMSGLASVHDRSSGEQTASGEQLHEESLTARRGKTVVRL
jgi:rare lipoprotein A (peptidoglycan hydrolase)